MAVLFSRNIGYGPPLFDGILNVALLLSLDGGSNRSVYHRRCGIGSDICHRPGRLGWVLADDLGIQFCQPDLSLIVDRCNLLNKPHGFFCIFLGGLHMLAGLGLDLTESLKTEKAENDSSNSDRRQECSGRCHAYTHDSEPAINRLLALVETLLGINSASRALGLGR